MVELDDVIAFIRVTEAGSFARAADRLGLAKSIVSRRVARLEAGLGARLLTRTAKGAQPTEVGRAYYARAAGGLAELNAAQEVVAQAMSEIAGPIRISAPVSFGVQYLGPALVEFAVRYPRVELDVSYDDRMVDLIGQGFDLGIRIGNLPDSALMARRLAPIRRVLVASPAYIFQHGPIERPTDIAGRSVLLYANAGVGESWRFRVDGRWEQVRVNGRFRADNGELLCQAACAGLGLALLPTFIASSAIDAGQLKILMPEFPPDEVGLHAMMPPGRSVTARVRALVDALAICFGPEPSWDPCQQSLHDAPPVELKETSKRPNQGR